MVDMRVASLETLWAAEKVGLSVALMVDLWALRLADQMVETKVYKTELK